MMERFLTLVGILGPIIGIPFMVASIVMMPDTVPLWLRLGLGGITTTVGGLVMVVCAPWFGPGAWPPQGRKREVR